MNTELNALREHLDKRFDKIEDKIDNHLERISKAETSIEWLRGHSNVVLTILITGFCGMAGVIYQYVSHK